MHKHDSADSNLVPPQVLGSQIGIKPADLRREALEGRLPCVRVGTQGILFDRDAVIAILAERARGASDKRLENEGQAQ